MATEPTAPTDNDPDLFDLAATLAGVPTVDLLKVRRDPAGLVVILATGQKFVFDPGALGAQLDTVIRAHLQSVLDGAAAAPAAALTAADSAPKRRSVKK